MRLVRVGWALLILLVLAIGGYVLWAQEPVIAGIEPPPRSAFDPALIETGARLAAIGNCASCHTAPGGDAYAGGRPFRTPLGTLYSTNITPAPGNGIGRWSEAAFRRAMRQGVARRGEHLYPAFPYDHYARLDDADLHALYAFVMTRAPAETFTPPLRFPLNQRWALNLWNLFFLDRTPFHPDPARSPEWNRGAYLVEGIGHCGSCHTPRSVFAAEKTSEPLAGGEAEGWRAPALDAASPAPLPWDRAQLFAYLRHGWDAEHGAATGPMRPVVDSLAPADDADLHAIAGYLAAPPDKIPPPRKERADAAAARAATAGLPPPATGEEAAAALFAGACAACHVGGTAMLPPHGINLALSTAISEADPRNAIRIVLDGVRPGGDGAGPLMPEFDGVFTDAQLVALLSYIRAHYGGGPAWTDLAAQLRDIRADRKR